MNEPQRRPTVHVEIPGRTIGDIEAAVGRRLRGLLIIAETDTGELRTLIPDWMEPGTLADMAKDVAHGLSCDGDCGYC